MILSQLMITVQLCFVCLPIGLFRAVFIFRPATHPDLIGISGFFSTNLGVSRFPDSTCENPEFLFHFEIGKTKGRLTLLHGPCLQTHKVWAKNKDRLNPLHTASEVDLALPLFPVAQN